MSKTVGYIPPKEQPQEVFQQEPEIIQEPEDIEVPKAGKIGKGKKEEPDGEKNR